MATKKVNRKKETNNFKAKAKSLHAEVIAVSDDLVEDTIATGEKWQTLMGKTLKEGVNLYGKQQDLVLTTLESLKGQYSTGSYRLRKLLGFDTSTAQKTTKAVVKKVKITTAKARTTVKKALENNDLETIETTTKKAIKKTAKQVKAAAKKATTGIATVKTATNPSKKTNARVKATTPTTKIAQRDNLKIIEGIGPKIEELLNKAGIATFQQLATSPLTSLEKVLADAGPRYQMHVPSTWSEQAKLAATGKIEELKAWQAELKGGKNTKK